MGWGIWYPIGWMWLFWIAAIAVILFLVARAAGFPSPRGPAPHDSPEDTLRMRYARGEIDRREFQQRLQDLRQH